MAPSRIMIAEDEVIFAEDLQERVESLGYFVTANVTTAEAALQSAEQAPPDLVLMDIRLAGEMDGIDAAEALRSKSNIPVVFVTAYADEERLKRAKLSTPFGYLLKPIEDRQLKITIEMALEIDRKRKRAEEELAESRQLSEDLFRASYSGIYVYEYQEPDRLILVDANALAEKMTGVKLCDWKGKEFNEVWPQARTDGWADIYLEVARSGKTYERENVVYEDERVSVAIRARIFQLPKHRVAVSFEDISEKKQAEEEQRKLEAQMQQAQKLESLGVLAGGIAHDFNNILTGLLGNADLALSGLPSHSPVRPLLHDIQKAGRQAADLTSQMLAYSGKGRFVVEDIDINALVRDMSSLLESSTSKKVGLSYDLSADLPAVRADATQLRQIVLNLVSNASEAVGDKGGLVRISTNTTECDRAFLDAASPDKDLHEGRYVTIEVSDTGCGMDAETKAKVFDPFFTTKFTGRGLGLAAVQGIVRGHKGAILVESTLGKETTFKVLLPALDHPAAAVATGTKEDNAWHGTGTILVVDDEEMVRRVAARMLKRAGFSVLMASDGAEAVEMFRERHDEIACVLLDLKMPHMDGEETFDELRKIEGDLPVILSSGYSEQESTERFAGKGLAGFLQKPYLAASLRESLRKALGDGE